MAESKDGKKHIERRWLVVAGLALVSLLFLIPFFREGGARVDTSVEVETVEAAVGDIRESTYGTGKITELARWDVSAPFAGVLSAWQVSEGDAVKAGDVLAVYDAASLDSQIEETLSALETLDETIQKLGEQTDFTVTAPASGVLKSVTAARGDDAAGETLAVLSTDGRMQVSFTPAEEAQPEQGQYVSLFSTSSRFEGTVERIADGTVTVTFPDEGKLSAGDEVEVLDRSGALLGEGTVDWNAPVSVTTDRVGIITKAEHTAGETVEEGDVLFTAVDVSGEDECAALVEQRGTLVDRLTKLRRFRDKPEVTAEEAGIVSDFALKAGETGTEAQTLCRITSENRYLVAVTVPVRSADRIREGQRVELRFADGDSVCTGQVAAGVSEEDRSGTFCTVDVTMEDNCGHKTGDEGRAEIVLAEHTGAVLIPAQSVSLDTDGVETVNVAYGDGLTKSCGIVTGLNNGTQVEVLQGVSEGDKIVVSSRIVETTFYSLFNHEWVVNQKEGPEADGLVTEAPAETETGSE